ncbi:hypothetical protein C5C36_01520 [Rathayibacter sp. AY1G1]|uniref:hypothetical protein n=1 Tax=unclassified Rathayibacter TaxID=2609250 RepID=UPI000CE89844|nr:MULTISPECIES: hypothetical protein [unclassified Rathayibacter]PPF11897.1 hypothetical protein C5B98_07140 [Rathayibacter sp. AY1A5]PPF14501.1 hypothetical protein C5B92_14905 [Rathayibacter sp. AY1A4]PPF16560.1 hypothetical protein C5B95_15680 [Rathayibacter sp. AY1A7]PPF29057.1 hypothetical protein C5C54_05220 [Rathayibacter sp. AY1F2]PPF33677.1 hypothetical protein C5C10_10595 [Rathayibacter sp. AY1A3]
MKNILLIVIGIGLGFAVAHQVSRTEAGARLFADINRTAKELGEAVSEGYHQREAELKAAIGEG